MKVKGFWGLEIEPEKSCVVLVDGSFKISMASISSFQGLDRTSVYMEFQDTRFLLCSLIPEKIEQQVIDITCLKGERISFRSVGPNCIHLMGNYVSQDDSESEEEIEKYAEKEIEKKAEKEKDAEEKKRENVDIANSLRYSFGYSVGGSVGGSIGDSDSDLYVDAPDLLDCPDMFNEAVPDNDEFDVGYICNFLETTFRPKEPSSDINNSSNLSNPVTLDQNQDQPQKPTSSLITPILVELVENTEKYKLLREENMKKREKNVERLEVEKLGVEQKATDKQTVEAEKRKIEKQVAEMQEAENRKIEKLEAEKLEADKRVSERVEAERVEAEKLNSEKLKADKLIIEKLKAEKLKAEKRVPKKRVHTRREYVVPETVELENTIPKNSVDSASVTVQVVHDPRSERASRNETQMLYKDQINPEYQSAEMADRISASHNDQVKSNDVPCNVDINLNAKAKVTPSKKARNPRAKGRSATAIKRTPVMDSSQENSQVEKAPMPKRPRRPSIPITMSTRSRGSAPEITESEVLSVRRRKSKSPVVEKALKDTPAKNISIKTDKETDVKKSTSKVNTKAKETLGEHIKEVDSIAPGTEITPIGRPKDKRPNVLKEKKTSNNFEDEQPAEKSEEIITSTNLENTNIEPVEVERAPSKKTKDSENKHVREPVKKIKNAVSQEEHIKTVSSESTNIEHLSNKTNNNSGFKNRVKVEGLLNQVAPSVLDEEYHSKSTTIENKPNKKKEGTPIAPPEPNHIENISNKRTRSHKTKQNPVHNHTEEIPVEETRSNKLNQEINTVEKPSNNTKNANMKKAYQNIPTEEDAKETEAEIPNIETTPKKEEAKISKNTSATSKRSIKDVSQEIPTENRNDCVQKNNDKLPTISDPSHTNKQTKVEASSKEIVTKEKNIEDGTYSFEELLRRERERKKLAKLKKLEKKQKKREAKALLKYKKEAGDSPKESSKSQKDIDVPASTPAANSTKETFKKQSNTKSPAVIEISAQQNRTQKRKEEEDPDYTPGAQRKKSAVKKRKLLK